MSAGSGRRSYTSADAIRGQRELVVVFELANRGGPRCACVRRIWQPWAAGRGRLAPLAATLKH
eukprot:scaffold17374_cov69-Phaeocystis_antarctica.AAC.1